MFDPGPWLSPLATAVPAGESLRNDPRFHDIERLMAPRFDVARDDRNNPVSQVEVQVDWSAVLRAAADLSKDGRDLRLLVIVTRALVNTSAFRGLADGLSLIAATFATYWDAMHPELRPDAPPREAALRRINALLQLQGADDGALGDLRRQVFFTPRGLAAITGRDLERGTLDGRTVVNEAASGLSETEKAALAGAQDQLITRVRAGLAAAADQSGPDLAALRDDARAARAALAATEAALKDRLGGTEVGLPDLARFLDRVVATLDRATAAGSATAGSTPAPTAASDGAAAAFSTTTGVIGFPDRLSSRNDVVTCLDLIIAFYDRTEPSSPIPHLARRIRRMVPMDFLELMEDLAPSGLKEFRLLAGVDGKKATGKDER